MRTKRTLWTPSFTVRRQVSINKALIPLSLLYGIVVIIRNKLFDWKILPVEEFNVPIISIGNLTVGGTGKTPHTEYLIRLLSKTSRLAVLSRGYKRKTKGFILADSSSDSKTIGDEPYQMYIKFPNIQIAVDGNRRRGIKMLLQQPEQIRPEIILLDDAFQHRYVKPSLSILLSDYNRMIYDDFLLPAGRLREPVKNKSRAGIVIITKCPDDLNPIDYRIIKKNLKLYPYQSLFFTSFKYGNLKAIFKNESLDLEVLKKKKIAVLLVTGIASPQNLIKKLTEYTNSIEIMTFPDHHDFSKKDICEVEKKFEKIPGENKLIITTEKDAVRLLSNIQLNKKTKNVLYYLPIEVDFNLDGENSFNNKIENHVRNIKRNRSVSS